MRAAHAAAAEARPECHKREAVEGTGPAAQSTGKHALLCAATSSSPSACITVPKLRSARSVRSKDIESRYAGVRKLQKREAVEGTGAAAHSTGA